MFDIINLKNLFLLNCESQKYIAKLLTLSKVTATKNYQQTDKTLRKQKNKDKRTRADFFY